MSHEIPSFKDAFRVWLKIGLLSFGGPAGQIALMHRILVDEKRWISETRFLHALNYAMLLPGPEAQQLATYAGWLLHRTLGGLVAGVLFVLPGADVMLVLSVLYAGFRDVTSVEAIFFWIKGAVLAIVIQAVIRLSSRALPNAMLMTFAAVSFFAIFAFAVPFPLVIAGAALAGFLGYRLLPDLFPTGGAHAAENASASGTFAIDAMLDRGLLQHTRPSARRAAVVLIVCLVLWLGPLAILQAMVGPDHVFTQQGVFFSKMAVVTFGGADAVLAYVAQQAVEIFGWLAPGEMLDGLGMAETTPSPLIMVVQHVGFLAAFRNPGALDPMLSGAIGAALTTWVTFVPCFLWIFLGAPYIESQRDNRMLSAGLTAITAAVVGVILNLAVWFGIHASFAEVNEFDWGPVRLSLPDSPTFEPAVLLITVAALIATLRYKAGMFATLAAAAGLGVACYYLFS